VTTMTRGVRGGLVKSRANRGLRRPRRKTPDGESAHPGTLGRPLRAPARTSSLKSTSAGGPAESQRHLGSHPSASHKSEDLGDSSVSSSASRPSRVSPALFEA